MKELKQATETSINHLINDLAMNMIGTSNKWFFFLLVTHHFYYNKKKHSKKNSLYLMYN